MSPGFLRNLWIPSLLILYVAFSAAHISDPFQDEETWEFYASKKLIEVGVPQTVTGESNMYHPHGYYYLIGLTMRLLGVNEVGARVFGVLATILTFFLMLRILARLNGGLDPLMGALMGVLYLLSPAVIQASLVITADTGAHHLFVTLFLLYAIERFPYRRLDYVVLAGLLALMMWIKFATPFVVVFSMVLFFLAKRDWDTSLHSLFFIGAGGLALFLSTWALYCHWIGESASTVVEYMLMQVRSRGETNTALAKTLTTGRWILMLGVWLGVPYGALMIRSIFQYRERPQEHAPMLGLLLVMGSVMALFHLFVSGIPYAYPRYHFTMLPLWAIIVTFFGSSALRAARFRPSTLCLLAGGGTAYFLLLVGDPMHTVIHELKVFFLKLPALPSKSSGWFALQLLLLFGPSLVLLIVSFHRRLAARSLAALICLTFASNLSLNLVQLQAPYATGASYGEAGTPQALAYINERLDANNEILAGKDIVYHAGGRGFMHDWAWGERPFMLDRMRASRNQFIVLGLHHNTMALIHEMFDSEEYKSVLEKEYDHFVIGSYFIWERRPEDRPAAIRGTRDRSPLRESPLRAVEEHR